MQWRMPQMCADCPFAPSGPGLRLRRSLGKGRWTEIIQCLKRDKHFICHKTSNETGNATNLICAGSIEYSEDHNIPPSQLQRIMERIDYMNSKKGGQNARG